MNQLLKGAPVIIGEICSYLATNDLLNCRLVCKPFKQEVDRTLSTVTYVKINFETLDHELMIPSVLYPSAISREFDCHHSKLSDLFTFLQEKCANLTVVQDHTWVSHWDVARVLIQDLQKVSKKLAYFEGYIEENDTSSTEMRKLFPCLKIVRDILEPQCFCLTDWSGPPADPNAPVGKLNQWSDACCHFHGAPTDEIPPGTVLVSGNFCSATLRKLSQQSIIDSVQVLCRIIDAEGSSFFLPNLLYADFLNGDEDPSALFNSLNHSTKLQVLNLSFTYAEELDFEGLASLVNSLKELKFLKMTLLYPQRPPTLKLSLSPQLSTLAIEGFEVEFLDEISTSLQFVHLNKISFFSLICPNLIECILEFENSIRKDGLHATLILLRNSVNLRKLCLPSCTFLPLYPSIPRSIYSLLHQLKKLEHFFIETRGASLDLDFCDHPSFRRFTWFDKHTLKDGTSKRDVHLDGGYEWIKYWTETSFTARQPNKYPIRVSFPDGTQVHFKHPLEKTVTEATFNAPQKSLSFQLPHLLKLKVIIYDFCTLDNIIETLCPSLSHSPDLQVFTLIFNTHHDLTLAEFEMLLSALNNLEHLERLEGEVRLNFNSTSLNSDSYASKYPVLDQVKCNWQLHFNKTKPKRGRKKN